MKSRPCQYPAVSIWAGSRRRAPLAGVWLTVAALLAFGSAAAGLRAAGFPEAQVFEFTDRHCSSCHNDVDKEGGLDLTSLTYAPDDAENFLTWVKVHDRVQTGEMPPKDKRRPDGAEMQSFVGGLAAVLSASEEEALAREGRATRRRLNRSEYENVLRDLLQAPWLQVKEQLPEDGEAHRFNKVSQALDVSHVHMTRYMSAAEEAMRQVMGVHYARPPTTRKRYYAREEGSLTRFSNRRVDGNPTPDRNTFPVLGYDAQHEVRMMEAPMTVGDADPAMRDQEAVGWVSSNYVTGFSSGWTNFRAPVAGRYRLSFSGYTLWVGPNGIWRQTLGTGEFKRQVPFPPAWYVPNYEDISKGRRYEPITVYAQGGPANRRLGGFDLMPEPTAADLGEVWLVANEYIVTDASRFYRSRPTGRPAPFQFTNALAQRDGQPAVAFRWMDVEGPIYDDSTGAGYRLLFGALPMQQVDANNPGVSLQVVAEAPAGGRGRGGQGGRGGRGTVLSNISVEVVSASPEQDAEKLLRAFIGRAYRNPTREADVQLFLGLVQQRLKAGLGFAGAMLAGYTAVLSSPEFVFLDEQPGRLDDHALATRLALFLWNSEPDAALRARADKGELQRPEVLRAEAERMLVDARSHRFVEAFLDYWLEIRRMEETTPSTTLYNDYYLDDSLTEAAQAETRLYFTELLRRDLPARNIVDSNFTFLNDRLAIHYGIPGVEGVGMRRVALPGDSVRGGFMTQASVLKVTANGTTTSPVLRGKWIMERIVGFDIPPPPAAVPAVEPDIRGAVTIRDQLDKHSADESCAMCHRKIDPPGFALESFDVMGAWRDRYRANAPDKAPEHGFGKNGWPYAFNLALPVDASGRMDDGREFANVRDFKRLLLDDEVQIARNFARQLTVYATGAPVRFSERPKIEQILEQTRAREYGVRSLVHELVQSDLFRSK